MRILQVVHQYLPHMGGTEVYVHDLSQELSRRGHQVMVFTRSLTSTAEQPPGMSVYGVRTDGRSPSAWDGFRSIFGDPRVEKAFSHVCRSWQPQVIHFHHLLGLSGRLVTMAKEQGLLVVFTLHDYWFLCPGAQMVSRAKRQICHSQGHSLECARCALARLKLTDSQPLAFLVAPLFWLRQRWAGRILRQADVLIAPSNFLTDTFVQAGLPPERLRFSPLGIDLAPFTEHLRQKDEEGRLKVAYIGALAWQKGVHLLVEAANLLSEEDIEVRIYGDPQAFPDYTAQLKSSIRQEHVALAGRLERSQVPQALSRADVLVVPSVWWENDPLVVKEAFAARVPVVASNLGALSRLVRHEVDGLLFEPGDPADLAHKLALLARDRTLLEKLRSGIQPPKSIAQDATELEALYRSHMAPGGGLSTSSAMRGRSES